MKIKIDGWKCNLTFSSAHFLADYSKCSHLHGHTYSVSAVIEGEMREGIIIDFRIVKNAIKKIIEKIDHKIIIPAEGKFEIRRGKEVEVRYKNRVYIFPEDDCVFLPLYSSSAENIAKYILKEIVAEINNENIKSIEIGVDEGYGQGAWIKWEKKQSV
ncbi:MAG TPA: 6-carboxytetrahydropterin synthase [Thermoplasmatales archaeon]|nr:6-carboxytetrahydropterin synthase [Thermoplasmatales archaeon]